MPDNSRVELVIEVNVDKANQNIKSVNASLSGIENSALKATRGASQGLDGMTAAMAKGAAAGNLLADAFKNALGLLREYGTEIVKYAARTETMGVVTQQLSKVNGYSVESVGRLVERIKTLGISTQEAHATVQRMIFAELDLSKATQLARVAQDAAVISGTNSSEALESIIIGITTGQTRLLHNMGLQVSLEQTIQEEQKKRGRTITDSEKREAMLNKVLSEGVKINGAYSAAMDTSGKQWTSLTRLWQEAQNALGSEFLPEFSKLIKALGELADWIKDNSHGIAEFIRFFGAAVAGAALGQFIAWIGEAEKAVIALNAAMMANPWVAAGTLLTVAGYVGYQKYKEYQEQQAGAEKEGRNSGIREAIKRGTSVADLKKSGYSEDDIRFAVSGGKSQIGNGREAIFGAGGPSDEAGFKAAFADKQKKAEEERQREEAKKQAEFILRKRNEYQLRLDDEAVASRRAGLTGITKDVADMNTDIKKGTTFLDRKGVERAAPLTAKEWDDILTILRNKWKAWQKEILKENRTWAKEYLDTLKESYDRYLEYESSFYQKRLAYEAAYHNDSIEKALEFEEQRAAVVRDSDLRKVEGTDPQNVRQKVWAEQQKAAIEIEYLMKVHNIKNKLFDLDSERQRLEEESNLKNLGYKADEIARKLYDFDSKRETIKDRGDQLNDASVIAARENAAIRSTQIIHEQYRSMFSSLKQQAGGVFDALLTKSQSVWSAIGNSFKTAILTAIKDVVTSKVAAMLVQLLTGAKISTGGIGGGGGVSVSGGGGGIMGRMGGLLGLGGIAAAGGGTGGGWGPLNTPVVMNGMGGTLGVSGGGGGILGRFGGLTTGGGGLVSLPGIGGTAPFVGGGSGGGGGLLGGLMGGGGAGSKWAGLKSFLGIEGSGSITLGNGTSTTWQAASMGQKLQGLGKSDAALMGGIALGMDGLRRGGWIGLGETTAAGALIGFKFGGPVGAAIGAAVGAAAGFIRMMFKGRDEKIIKEVKSAYGVTIDSQFAKVLAEQSKGQDLRVFIHSPQVREMIETYAQMTGQRTGVSDNKPRGVSLSQSGGVLSQSGIYINNEKFGYGSSLPGSSGLTMFQSTGATAPAGNTYLDKEGTKEFWQTVVSDGIIENPRAVQAANSSASRSSVGRRDMAATLYSPLEVV